MDIEGATGHRRKSDGKIPWVAIAERILLWVAILGIVGTGAIKYAKIVETIENSQITVKRVDDLERDRDVKSAKSDERWREVFARLDRIEFKIDRR